MKMNETVLLSTQMAIRTTQIYIVFRFRCRHYLEYLISIISAYPDFSPLQFTGKSQVHLTIKPVFRNISKTIPSPNTLKFKLFDTNDCISDISLILSVSNLSNTRFWRSGSAFMAAARLELLAVD